MREVVPTKGEALALVDERKLMREGFGFLDEKRMLLAGEMIRRLRDYQQRAHELDEARKAALAALAAAIERHGLEAIQLVEPPPRPMSAPAVHRTSLLGVALTAMSDEPLDPAEDTCARVRLDPSPEALRAAVAFKRYAALAASAGYVAGNLLRLAREYRRTERRAKALENVLLPEVDAILKQVVEELDALDQEETVQSRSHRPASLHGAGEPDGFRTPGLPREQRAKPRVVATTSSRSS